jgi:hypothetical protein
MLAPRSVAQFAARSAGLNEPDQRAIRARQMLAHAAGRSCRDEGVGARSPAPPEMGRGERPGVYH